MEDEPGAVCDSFGEGDKLDFGEKDATLKGLS
jgi:hypothetical protein